MTIKPKKRLGQHFLVDQRVVARIIQAIEPDQSDAIIEIGPGTGAITRPLAARAGYLAAIEADSDLAAELKAGIESDNVSIIQGDALAIEWDTLIDSTVQAFGARPCGWSKVPRVRIVGNLPYYISTPILQVLLAHSARIVDITVMLQDEVARRIGSPPGSREYGYLSVLTQFYCEVRSLFEVPPSSFRPAPEVRSAMVRLTVRRQPAVTVENPARYLALVRASFARRRKTILNNLKAAELFLGAGGPLGDALARAGIDPRRRAETLSLQEFAILCDSLYPARK
jgi:16S rRNA (adenine1518-N6/adenine1519-N6)-dimethyltransferase